MVSYHSCWCHCNFMWGGLKCGYHDGGDDGGDDGRHSQASCHVLRERWNTQKPYSVHKRICKCRLYRSYVWQIWYTLPGMTCVGFVPGVCVEIDMEVSVIYYFCLPQLLMSLYLHVRKIEVGLWWRRWWRGWWGMQSGWLMWPQRKLKYLGTLLKIQTLPKCRLSHRWVEEDSIGDCNPLSPICFYSSSPSVGIVLY